MNKEKLIQSPTVINSPATLTIRDKTINNKEILIPSFSTTSEIFNQHFIILKDLKKRMEGLRRAYLRQRDEERSWELVERIITILESACQYLDFPTILPG